jgi:hypothetical protein
LTAGIVGNWGISASRKITLRVLRVEMIKPVMMCSVLAMGQLIVLEQFGANLIQFDRFAGLGAPFAAENESLAFVPASFF